MNDLSTTAPHRGAGPALIAGGVIFFVTELIAATAWTNPSYSYLHHFISNLGVHGPSTAFGQFMYSPLAWVMNAGFALFGTVALAGVILLARMPGPRRWVTVTTAALLAAGGILVGLFPGSGEAFDNGTATYHGLGAFAVLTAGNVLAIRLGTMHRRLGLPRRLGVASVVLGVLGLLSLVAFMLVLATGGDTFIGLFERGAVYPFLLSFIGVGAALVKGRTSR
jgi:hypothetical membrane protein